MDNAHLIGEAVGQSGLVLLLVVGGSLITPALYNSLVSIRGVIFGRYCFRHGLERRITHSRLGNMLTRKGVDLQYYLFSQPPSEIEQQIRNCKDCDSYDRCDCYLENRSLENKIVVPFCRNSVPILKIRSQQEKLYKLRNTNF